MSGSVLLELGRLSRSVPHPEASAREVAGWYSRKAALLERAADEEHGASAAALVIEAGRARRHAARLMKGAA